MALHGSFSVGVLYGKAKGKGMGKYKWAKLWAGKRQGQGVVWQYSAINHAAAATAATLVS